MEWKWVYTALDKKEIRFTQAKGWCAMKRLVVYAIRLLPAILTTAMQAQTVVRNDPALDKRELGLS